MVSGMFKKVQIEVQNKTCGLIYGEILRIMNNFNQIIQIYLF